MPVFIKSLSVLHHQRANTMSGLLVSFAVWTAIAGVHAASVWSDAIRRGRAPGFIELFLSYLVAYAPWVLFSAALYGMHTRTPTPWRRVWLASVGFLLVELMFQAALLASDAGLSAAGVIKGLVEMPMIFRLIDVAVLLATNAVVYAVVATRRQREVAAKEQQLQADNLALRLALERQRLEGLRAQLEPHFLFNALNAISGLVRGDDRALALTALQHLSRLLRYATTAVSRDSVPLADELAFLQEYLALQQLRFGERLHVHYEGFESVSNDQESPPLLLQPLAENAVRHGLERTDAVARITVCVVGGLASTSVLVSNTVPADAPPNPGLGVGLATLRDRIHVAYRGRATLTTVPGAHQFDVHLILPLHADE